MAEAYVYDHVRTPRGKGKKDGGLHQASPVWLLRTLLQALAQRNGLDTAQVDDPSARSTRCRWSRSSSAKRRPTRRWRAASTM